MLTDEDKHHICVTLENCWFFNYPAQMKCQEIFKTLNLIWNNLDTRNSVNL